MWVGIGFVEIENYFFKVKGKKRRGHTTCEGGRPETQPYLEQTLGRGLVTISGCWTILKADVTAHCPPPPGGASWLIPGHSASKQSHSVGLKSLSLIPSDRRHRCCSTGTDRNRDPSSLISSTPPHCPAPSPLPSLLPLSPTRQHETENHCCDQ